MNLPAGEEIVADACFLLNLVATGKAGEILRALETTLVVEEQVRGEVLYLAGPEDDEGRPTREPVDLAPLERERFLRTITLGGEAAGTLVKAAEFLTDQDARAVALAATMHLALATDDGLIRKVARAQFGLEMRSTLELVRDALDRMDLGEEEMRQVLLAMRDRGSFAPPRWDPNAEWYRAMLQGDA